MISRHRIALLIFAVTFAAVLQQTIIEPALADPVTVTPVLLDDWGTIHKEMVADATARADKIKIVFVGDSITARWTRSPGQSAWDKDYAPLGAINLGISADATQHVLWRLQHGVIAPLHPKMYILLIGTNNLGMEPDEVAYGVWAIVDYLRKSSPDSRVLVQGIFPRGDKADAERKRKIVNDYLAKLDDGKMVKYLYFGDAYLNADGTCNKELLTDGVHPNTPAGFTIWDAAILPTVKDWLTLAPVANVPPPASPVPTPANTAAATPALRNDFLFRHNRVLGTPAGMKTACGVVFLGGEDVSLWDRQQALFKKEFGEFKPLNFAIWGSRPENMLWQVVNGELDGMTPKIVIIHSQEGLRGSPLLPVERLAAGMDATAHAVLQKCPNTKVLIVGANPIGAKPADPQRKSADAYNALLAKLADDKSIYFVDAGKAFLNPDGTVVTAGIPDATNSTEAVYTIWGDAIRDALNRIAPSAAPKPN